MKKSVKNIAVILAALSLSSAFAATVSAKDIFVGPTTKAEKAVEVCTNKKVNCRDDFCGSPVFSAKNKGRLITCSDEDYCSDKVITGGKFLSCHDANKELDDFFKKNCYSFNMKVGENRFLCDGAYFYCDTPGIIDCKNGSFIAKAPGKAIVYAYTMGGVPFCRFDVAVGMKDVYCAETTLTVIPEYETIMVDDVIGFTVKASDGKCYRDIELTVKTGATRAEIDSKGRLVAKRNGTVVVHAESKSNPAIYGDCVVYIGEYRSAVSEGYWNKCDDGIRVDKWCPTDIWNNKLCSTSGWIKCYDGTLLPVVKTKDIEFEDCKGETHTVTVSRPVGIVNLDHVLGTYCGSDIVTVVNKYDLYKPGYYCHDYKFTWNDFDFRNFAFSLMLKDILG